MKRLFLFLSLFILAPLPAAAGDGLWDETEKAHADIQELPVALRENAIVNDEYIRLGDIFSGLNEELDDKPASKSPALGKDVILSADWLKELAFRHRIKWMPQNTDVKIVVKRAAKEITKEELLDVFTKELLIQGMPKTAQITLNKNWITAVLPVDTVYEIGMENVTYAPETYNISGTAHILVDGKTTETIELKGKAIPFVLIPIAQRSLSAGQIITDSDVAVKSVREDIVRNDIPARMEDLIGKEVKRTIRAGQPVTEDDVRTKVMVTKGKIVTLTFTKGGILLSTQGKALENGGLGDTVRVMNPQSKSVIQGTVTGPDTIVVAPGASAPRR